MKAVQNLPEGYEEIYSVNLQKDKKAALMVNLLACLIAVVMVVPACFLAPISSLFDMRAGIGSFSIKMLLIFVLIAAYLTLHELTHGVAMKICGTQKIKYGFTGLYAFAGSNDFYGKKAYTFIALAPVVLWAIILAIVNILVPAAWFWVIYIIQICNISGAAGDLFVTVRFSRFPEDILVKDSGVGMTVYARKD